MAKKSVQEIKEISDAVKATLEAYGKQRDLVKEIQGLQSKIAKASDDFKANAEGIKVLSDAQLKNKKEEVDLAINLLAEKTKGLKITKNSTDAEKEAVAAIKNKFKNEKDVRDLYIEEEKTRDRIKQKMGIFGGVLKGVSKIPILGNILNTEKILAKMVSAKGNIGAGFKEMGSQVISGLLNPSNLALGAITLMASALKGADKATGDLAKSMNLSYNEASGVRDELMAISNSSFDNAINTERLQETLSFVNKELGTSGKMSESNLKTFTKLRRQAGMTNEEIMSMQKFSMVMGGDLESNVVNFQAQAKALSMSKGSAVNVKQLMADMSKVLLLLIG